MSRRGAENAGREKNAAPHPKDWEEEGEEMNVVGSERDQGRGDFVDTPPCPQGTPVRDTVDGQATERRLWRESGDGRDRRRGESKKRKEKKKEEKKGDHIH